MKTSAFKFAIFPDKAQQDHIELTLRACRFVWNWALKQYNDSQDDYFKCKNEGTPELHVPVKRGDISKSLTLLKTQEQTSWLKDVNAQALIAELRHLHDSIIRYHKLRKSGVVKGLRKDGRPKGWPRPKRWFDYPQSYSNQQNKPTKNQPQQNRIKFNTINEHGDPQPGIGKLTILKLRNLRMMIHRPFTGSIGTVTISKEAAGKYFAAITVTESGNWPDKKPIVKSIGLDRGLTDFIVDSDGAHIKNPKHLARKAQRLAVLNRRLAKKRTNNPDYKSSKRYRRLREQKASLERDIKLVRIDKLHKTSYHYINTNDAVFIEDLNIKGMVKNRRLAKSISDASWGEFGRQLIYKGERTGVTVHKINRFTPSSKTCHVCGHIIESLPLNVRNWKCPNCNTEHQRDENAAKIIRQEGLAAVVPGVTGTTLNKVSPNLTSQCPGATIRRSLGVGGR